MEEEKTIQKNSLSASQLVQSEAQESSGRKKSKLPWIIGIGVFLLVLFAVGGSLLISFQNKEQTAENEVYHVGVLSGVENFAPTINSFKSEMEKLGYVENKDIFYDAKSLNDDPVQAKTISEQFVKDKVDLIFVFPEEVAITAKQAVEKSGIPVVFAWSPTDDGQLVTNISHPGGNVTGVRHSVNDYLLKTYDILMQIAPKTKRIWVVYDPRINSATDFLKEFRPIAKSNQVTLVDAADILTIDDLKSALQNLSKQNDVGFDAIMLLPNATTISPEGLALVSEFAKTRKIPLAGLTSAQVGSGILFGFGPTVDNVSRLAASQANKLLKGGEKAGDVPVITADGALDIDYRVAQEIGLKIPEAILSQAGRILH